MARARNIKPGFFTNDALVELSFETRLLFIGLWTLADREGRLNDRPKKIKMELFPADSVDIDAMLAQLTNTGFLVRYESAEGQHIQIVNWHKHQNPHPKEAPSNIPVAEIPELVAEIPERAGQDLLIPSSLIPDSYSASARNKRGTPTPEQFEISPSLREWADAQEMPATMLQTETEKFLDHHRSKGSAFKDWNAAWRKWMRNAKEWAKPGGTRETRQPIDNSAPARVKRANERRERERIAEETRYAERVD